MFLTFRPFAASAGAFFSHAQIPALSRNLTDRCTRVAMRNVMQNLGTWRQSHFLKVTVNKATEEAGKQTQSQEEYKKRLEEAQKGWGYGGPEPDEPFYEEWLKAMDEGVKVVLENNRKIEEENARKLQKDSKV